MDGYEELRSYLLGLGGVVIGYSGGVDSTFLAKAATDALGERAVCVLVESCLVPGIEIEEAVATAEQIGLHLVKIEVDALATEHVSANEPDRCYHCKKAIFGRLVEIAREYGISFVLDGANADDESDFRPGSRATAELRVKSPLKELGLTKERVRSISRELGLPTWNKPSYACLASRIPYGTRLTREALSRVEEAEGVLRVLGFGQFRVRDHGGIARIEVLPTDMEKLMEPATRRQIIKTFKELGYKYVAMDMQGYRTGSMNETL